MGQRTDTRKFFKKNNSNPRSGKKNKQMTDKNQAGLLSPSSTNKMIQFSSFVVSPMTNGERSFWSGGNCTPGGLFDSLKTPGGMTPGFSLNALDTPTLFGFSESQMPAQREEEREAESDSAVSTKPPSPAPVQQQTHLHPLQPAPTALPPRTPKPAKTRRATPNFQARVRAQPENGETRELYHHA